MGASDFSKLPYIGEALKRKEDYRFLTGAGQYTDDVVLAAQSHAVFVRSPHAHAKINRINVDAAQAAPGVLGVFTGADVAADNINGLPCGWLITSTNGELAGTIGTLVDVTERKRAQEALRAEKERAEVTLASIGDGVITTDLGGRIETINEAAQLMTGFTADQALGRQLDDVFRLYEEPASRTASARACVHRPCAMARGKPNKRALSADRWMGL